MLVRAAVIVSANRSRSTASAAPAGTRLAQPRASRATPSRRISSLEEPTALSSLLFSEFITKTDLDFGKRSIDLN